MRRFNPSTGNDVSARVFLVESASLLNQFSIEMPSTAGLSTA